MARYYHDGSRNNVPSLNHPTLGRAVKVPSTFWPVDPNVRDEMGRPMRVPQYAPLPEDAICISLMDYGFFVVPPGGSIEIPENVIRPDRLKNLAPQLLTEDEARAAGLIPDGNSKPAPTRRAK